MPPNDSRLRAYFQGATDADRDIRISGYLIGVYGPDYVCTYIRDTFGITHLWPWLPRPPAYPKFDYDLWQQENGQTLCGVSVDLNDCQLEGWITEGADVAFKDDPDAQAFVADVKSTLDAMKATYDPIAAAYLKHKHDAPLITYAVNAATSEPK